MNMDLTVVSAMLTELENKKSLLINSDYESL